MTMTKSNQGSASGQAPVCSREMGEARESMGFLRGGRATGCERNCGHAVQGSVAVLESLEQRVLAQVQKEEPEDMKGLA